MTFCQYRLSHFAHIPLVEKVMTSYKSCFRHCTRVDPLLCTWGVLCLTLCASLASCIDLYPLPFKKFIELMRDTIQFQFHHCVSVPFHSRSVWRARRGAGVHSESDSRNQQHFHKTQLNWKQVTTLYFYKQ